MHVQIIISYYYQLAMRVWLSCYGYYEESTILYSSYTLKEASTIPYDIYTTCILGHSVHHIQLAILIGISAPRLHGQNIITAWLLDRTIANCQLNGQLKEHGTKCIILHLNQLYTLSVLLIDNLYSYKVASMLASQPQLQCQTIYSYMHD